MRADNSHSFSIIQRELRALIAVKNQISTIIELAASTLYPQAGAQETKNESDESTNTIINLAIEQLKKETPSLLEHFISSNLISDSCEYALQGKYNVLCIMYLRLHRLHLYLSHILDEPKPTSLFLIRNPAIERGIVHYDSERDTITSMISLNHLFDFGRTESVAQYRRLFSKLTDCESSIPMPTRTQEAAPALDENTKRETVSRKKTTEDDNDREATLFDFTVFSNALSTYQKPTSTSETITLRNALNILKESENLIPENLNVAKTNFLLEKLDALPQSIFASSREKEQLREPFLNVQCLQKKLDMLVASDTEAKGTDDESLKGKINKAKGDRDKALIALIKPIKACNALAAPLRNLLSLAHSLNNLALSLNNVEYEEALLHYNNVNFDYLATFPDLASALKKAFTKQEELASLCFEFICNKGFKELQTLNLQLHKLLELFTTTCSGHITWNENQITMATIARVNTIAKVNNDIDFSQLKNAIVRYHTLAKPKVLGIAEHATITPYIEDKYLYLQCYAQGDADTIKKARDYFYRASAAIAKKQSTKIDESIEPQLRDALLLTQAFHLDQEKTFATLLSIVLKLPLKGEITDALFIKLDDNGDIDKAYFTQQVHTLRTLYLQGGNLNELPMQSRIRTEENNSIPFTLVFPHFSQVEIADIYHAIRDYFHLTPPPSDQYSISAITKQTLRDHDDEALISINVKFDNGDALAWSCYLGNLEQHLINKNHIDENTDHCILTLATLLESSMSSNPPHFELGAWILSLPFMHKVHLSCIQDSEKQIDAFTANKQLQVVKNAFLGTKETYLAICAAITVIDSPTQYPYFIEGLIKASFLFTILENYRERFLSIAHDTRIIDNSHKKSQEYRMIRACDRFSLLTKSGILRKHLVLAKRSMQAQGIGNTLSPLAFFSSSSTSRSFSFSIQLPTGINMDDYISEMSTIYNIEALYPVANVCIDQNLKHNTLTVRFDSKTKEHEFTCSQMLLEAFNTLMESEKLPPQTQFTLCGRDATQARVLAPGV